MLLSVASEDHSLCVDFFEDVSGAFGFEHFRAEPEDAGRWTATGGFGSSRFATPIEAVAAAKESVYWLSQSRYAPTRLHEWLTTEFRSAGGDES